MHILSRQQIKEWDQYTITHEPISSFDLMERAATKCVDWLQRQNLKEKHFTFFCGKGNNGGDGLAIARMLLNEGYSVTIYIPETGKPGSQDFEINLQHLQSFYKQVTFLHSIQEFPTIDPDSVIIDALFGSGLNKPLEGLIADLVNHLNKYASLIIAIDVPSGLFMERSSKGGMVVKATHTLTFQCPKLALLIQENAPYIGEVHILDIGLDPEFLHTQQFLYELSDPELIHTIYRPRNRFAHKGNFGHALLIAGSYGKMGAAVMAAKACLRGGSGLLTCHIPKCGYTIMQSALPEAMTIMDRDEEQVTELPVDIERYSCIGIGPGIGTSDPTQNLISFIVRRFTKPLVIDADGLNCISLHPELLKQLPRHSVLTPHPKEFDRIFGDHDNDFERISTALERAKAYNIIIVLKGHHTLIAMPDETSYFNSTGNAGMAKGGSGDVLTGIITSLLAQGYEPWKAAVLGVYIHGLAGDFAAEAYSQEAMVATDIISYLSKVFLALKSNK